MPSPVPQRAREAQTASRVLMIRPARFAANPETAPTNAFQAREGSGRDVHARALREFDGLVRTLRAAGVEVTVVEDTPEPVKPDAVFPNNWLSLHADGTAVLYPLLAENRRAEVRAEVLDALGGLRPRRVLDLRPRAAQEGFLEGTGSLVLDRAARIAYACLSPRTSQAMLARFCRELGYEALAFHGFDAREQAIYHTNVMLSVGSRLAVVCLEAVPDARERAALEARLAHEHELVRITREQMDEFAGNLLELRSSGGEALFVLSERARRALRADQVAQLERHGRLVSSDLASIEAHGGGSARCMLAEVFDGGSSD